jgi:dihydroorotase
MREAGIVAVSDDGKPVAHGGLMRRALEYARTFGLPVIQHAEDPAISGGAPVHEGLASLRAGLRGQPGAAEEAMVARDLALLELTGGRYHVAHVSTAGAVRLIREARRRGLPVTCEVTPHHLTLTDEACLTWDTSTKCNPPLRAPSDRAALVEALADGTIDAIATDHAPHSPVEKQIEFDRAAFGMIGLETAVPLVLALVQGGALGLGQAVRLLSAGPARALGLPGGTLAEGAPADVTVLDLDRRFTLDPAALHSKSRNTPFLGRELRGRAMLTVVAGAVAHEESA